MTTTENVPEDPSVTIEFYREALKIAQERAKRLAVENIELKNRLNAKPEVILKQTAMSILGEGIHTGLRRGTDAPGAMDLHAAINGSLAAWSDALAYAVEGLEYMNIRLIREVQQ